LATKQSVWPNLEIASPKGGFYRHPDGKTTTLPNHGHRDIARPLIREILREISVAPDKFAKLMEDV